MVDKLAKALEGLKNIQFTTSIEDISMSKKEKMFFCALAADVIAPLTNMSAQNLSFVIESMINLCDDKDSDVRMVADESLNRIIMTLSESNMLKVQAELHKTIKKNGPARCLRAALSRFGQLSHYIRPNKGRAHAQMLIPCLIEIAKREEESVHETLASCLENIFKVLGVFALDNSLKSLIKAFLHNLSSANTVIRRCSASSIVTIVQYCRKPHVFSYFVLNSLLDCVVPICEDNSPELILGVLGCLRLLVPTLTCARNDEGISGSFGLRRKQDESILSVDRLIQTYELCLHYTNSKDHNIVAASLEALNQILQNPPQQLESFFLSPAGFSRSYVHSAKENRLWNRCGSEMSVACSLPPMDESFLLEDFDISSQFSSFSTVEQFEVKQSVSDSKDKFTFPDDDFKMVENPFKDKSLGKVLGSQSTLDVDSDSESIATSETKIPTNFLMRVETEDKDDEEFFECSRSNSRDELYSPTESEGFDGFVNVDVGSFTDTAIPLIYCARHLAASFLLNGSPNCLKSDRTVRVSIKSLALSCMSAIIKLHPVIMKMNLGKNQNDLCIQEISDVLLYSEHGDPQIRGSTNLLIGHFIYSALSESKGHSSDWLSDDKSKLKIGNLIDILLKGLKDGSSMCIRQVLSAVKICIDKGLFSVYNSYFLHLLEYLPALTNNSYWLVKVKLVEVLSELPYVCINELTGSNTYQEEVIDSVLIPLLGDEDHRVRLATAEALVRIVPSLNCGRSTVLNYAQPFTYDLHKWLKVKKEFSNNLHLCLPFSFILVDKEEFGFSDKIESSLSRIVAKLTHSLLVPGNKHFLFGCLEALKLLSQKYPTTVYSRAWNCWKPNNEKVEDNIFTSNLIIRVFSLLVTSPHLLDLAACSNGTWLLGNLFAGHSISNLKRNYQISPSSGGGEAIKLWDVFKSEQLSQLAEEMLTHLLKMLNFYSRLVDEVSLNPVTDSSVTANAFLPLLSPIKKQDKRGDDKIEDKKVKNFNNYKQTTQYTKLQQLLKNAHTNYKVSLDKSVGEKFLNLLESTLYTLSVLLEVATVQETGRCAEEILSYLRSVVSLQADPVVTCVIQLLKSLFGTNLALNWEEGKLVPSNFSGLHLFDSLFQLPTEFLGEKIRRRTNLNFLDSESLSGLHRKSDRKVVIKNTDKNWLATYIRLFEPMVVKSLQLYTITGNVKLQSNVLRLLNHLVQLRVNYCLLDGKQVFVNFVLKQFELIEHGQISGVEALLPHIFKFLIFLSYEKQHSKPILSVPKILQLCDGLMASNQSVLTHCIPALVPVVEDVFLSRSLVSSSEEKELETQREVLLSMLLRLTEFPQVMDLLTRILNESKTVEEKEKWKRWSRQVIDTLLPLASQDRLHIETLEGQISFVNVMASLSPNVLRPIDPLLKVLFVEPSDYNCPTSLNRWLSRVTVLLETILFVKEDTLLNRMEEITPGINFATLTPTRNLGSPDPFNVKSFFQVFEPSEAAGRFLLKIMSVVGHKILESTSSTVHLQQKLSIYFVCCFHILKSGTFHRISNALQNLLSKEQESLAMICSVYQRMFHLCPFLTCQFSYFLALLNYCDQDYWSEILGKPQTLSSRLVQNCGVICLSDYLCDNLSDSETLRYLLVNHIREIIVFSHEIPVKELLMTIHRRKSDWSLFMETISSRGLESSEPEIVEKLLRLLEITESSNSGTLLVLLVNKFLSSPRLTLSLLAGSIACRQVESLLTLTDEKIREQISSETFDELMDFFKNQKYLKRHSTLWGLLNKLRFQVFESPLSDLSQSEIVNKNDLKNVTLDEDWYFDQVRQRCCQGKMLKRSPGSEMACLLSKLSYGRIVEIMSAPEFNIRILKDCLIYPETLRQKYELQEFDNKGYKSFIIDDPLYKASKSRLLKSVNEMSEMIKKARKDLCTVETSTHQVLEKMASERGFYERVWEIIPCLTVLLEIIQSENSDVESEYVEGVVELGVLVPEIIEWMIERGKEGERKELWQRDLENGLKWCSVAIKSRKVSCFLSQSSNRERLKIFVKNIFTIVSHLIPFSRFSRILRDEDLMNGSEVAQLEFLLTFIMTKSNDGLLPNHLMNCIRDLIVNLCRIPELSVHVLNVSEICDIQDIELLENFISRFSLIGWTSRQQFEEIWVALLAVLGLNTQGNVSLEETGFIVQASSVAVEGMTTLLKNTMLDLVSKKLIHHGRDSLSMKNIYEKLPLVNNIYRRDQFSDRTHHFLDNLEIYQRDDRYIHGLLSVEYLWTAIKQISSQVDLYEKHCSELNAAGLDLPSCIHLLTELYNQWIYQASPDIKIVTSSLKSSIVISDLFTDMAQFQWLLNFCFRIDEIVIHEDTVILPLIILGCSKAGAIVLPESEVCEKIKKLMLRSNTLPCRIASIQGLLYLLQSYIVCYAVNHTSLPPAGSTFQTDEANFVANIVDTFLPVALDIIQQFILKPEPLMEEYERCHWSLLFYLLQHYQPSLGDLKEEFFNFILTTLRSKNCSNSIMSLLIRGTERLLLTTVMDENFRDQLSKVSLEIISNSSITIARHGLQLLMVLSFLDKRVKDIRQLVTGQDDPEKVMKDVEKINILFEKLKRSHPTEAEIIGDVIAYVLMDFTASDVLTKVIQEFLSSHQPHQKILAGLLFKVFERAELSLLEDWVVFSLPSFIQGLPIAMSIWTLNCFFVSASSEPWLRSLFPLVQSRIRMAEAEDKKLLCLSAAHFYRQLKQESQKKSFVETFEKAAKADTVFFDLLSYLH